MGKGYLYTLAGIGTGGLLSAGWAGATGSEHSFLQNFARGGWASLAGKNFGTNFLKGKAVSDPSQKLFNADWMNKWGKYAIKPFEKSAENWLLKYGEYGEKGRDLFGSDFYLHALGAGFTAGLIQSGLDYSFDKLVPKIKIGGRYLADIDGTQNLRSILQIPVTYYTVDGLKTSFLFNNAGKSYRDYLKKRKELGLDAEKIPMRILSSFGMFMSFRAGLGF